MPVVPRPQNTSVMPQVGRVAAFDNPLAMAAATLAGRQISELGEAIQSSAPGVSEAADAAYALARSAKDKAETMVALDGSNTLQGIVAKLSNPQTGYRSLLGADAVKGINGWSLTDHYLSVFDKGWKDISSKLTPGPQAMFDQSAANMRKDFARDLIAHEAEQGRVWQSEVLNTAVANATGAIVSGTGSDDAAHVAKAKAALFADGLGQGLSGEDLVKQTAFAFGRSVAEPVVTARLAQGDVAGAKAFFDTHRDGMAVDDADKLEPKLNEAEDAAKTAAAVDDIWKIHGPASLDAPIDMDAIEQDMVRRYGGDDKALLRARDEFLHRLTGHVETRDEIHAGYVNKAIGQIKDGASPAQVAILPQFLALPEDRQKQIADWQREQLADKLTGFAPDQNLNRMAQQFAAYQAVSNPQTLQQMSDARIGAMEPVLGEALTRQVMAQKEAPPSFDDTSFRAVALSMGIDPAPEPLDVLGKARLGLLHARIDTAIAAAEAGGKTLTSLQRRDIAFGEGAGLVQGHPFFDLPDMVQTILETKPDDAFGVDLPVNTPADVNQAGKKGDRVQEIQVTTEIPIANSGMDGKPNTARSDLGPKPRVWVITPSGRRVSLIPETGTADDTTLYLTLKDDDTKETVKRVIETPAAGARRDIDFGSLGHVVMVSPKRQGMLSQAATSFANGALGAFSSQGVGDRDLIRAFASDPGKVLGDMAMAVPRGIGNGWNTVATDNGRRRFVDGIGSSLNKMAGDIGDAYRNHNLASYAFDKLGRLVPTTIDTVATGGENLLAEGGTKGVGRELVEQEVLERARDNAFIDLANTTDLAPGFYRADPKHLRFGQHVASPNFGDGGTISDLIVELARGKSPDTVGKPLRVIVQDGKTFTLDNRRLVAFNGAGLGDIAIQVVDKNDPEIMRLLKNPTRMNPIGGEGKSIVIAPGIEHASVRELLRLKNLIK